MEGVGVAAGFISMGRNDFDNDRLGLVGALVGPLGCFVVGLTLGCFVVGLTLGCFVVGLTLGCVVGRLVGLVVG